MSWTHPEIKAVSRQISDALVTQLPSSSHAHEMKPVLLDDIIEEVKDKRIAYEENIL